DEVRRLDLPRGQYAGLLRDRNRDERLLDHALFTVDRHAGAVPTGQVLPAARALVTVLVHDGQRAAESLWLRGDPGRSDALHRGLLRERPDHHEVHRPHAVRQRPCGPSWKKVVWLVSLSCARYFH